VTSKHHLVGRCLIRKIYRIISSSSVMVNFFNFFSRNIQRNKFLGFIHKIIIYKISKFYHGMNMSGTSEPMVMLDSATKFHDYIYIHGWFFAQDPLQTIAVHGDNPMTTKIRVNLPHGGVLDLGLNLGFTVSILCTDSIYPDELSLTFYYGSAKFTVSVRDLIHRRISKYEMSAKRRFDDLLLSENNLKILDVGGRNRSKVDRSAFYGRQHEVTVLDIAPGDNVDVVGDAHCMSKYFKAGHFDVVVSTSVFEHLHSPWKAVVEINRVLKDGGFVLIQTHQTLGMHDMPWDFWRFSNEAWKALFNSTTGFEILETNMTHESYILPFLFRRDKVDAEKSAGYELSVVLARKVDKCRQEWWVDTDSISDKGYPLDDDGFDPEKMGIVFK
jgi:SAM-dependent methyltransferase